MKTLDVLRVAFVASIIGWIAGMYQGYSIQQNECFSVLKSTIYPEEEL